MLDKTGKSSSLDSDFKDLMSLMMMSSMGGTSSMGSLNNSTTSDNRTIGMSSSMMFMPIILTLFEKMLSMKLGELDTPASKSAPRIGTSGTLADAQRIHVNQFDAERLVGGDGVNANCGPTSLVMALRSLGIIPSAGNAGSAVDLARRLMVSDPARDGVTASGARSEAENSTFTNFTDIERGARKSGAGVASIAATASSIRTALMQGGKVILSGTFVGKSPLPWTGDRGSDNSIAPGGATAHIVAVTGYDSASGKFIVNDPARKGPHLVSAATLDYFMQGNAGAVALYRISSPFSSH